MLLVEKADRIALVTLNRPEAMNALNRALRAALYEAMAALSSDPEVSVVILTGAGERACSAGLALKELGADPAAMGAAHAAAGELQVHSVARRTPPTATACQALRRRHQAARGGDGWRPSERSPVAKRRTRSASSP